MKIVDRIEGQFAVCEDSETENIENIPLAALPESIQEGDCLIFTDGVWLVDNEVTMERRKAAKELLLNLFKK